MSLVKFLQVCQTFIECVRGGVDESNLSSFIEKRDRSERKEAQPEAEAEAEAEADCCESRSSPSQDEARLELIAATNTKNGANLIEMSSFSNLRCLTF